jgi:hypothetical protein
MFVRVLQNDPNWHTGIVYPVPYAIDRKKLANILVTGGFLDWWMATALFARR